MADDAGMDGALLGQSCSGCHVASPRRADGIPPITGGAELLEARLREFKRGERSGTVMNRIARGYTDAELAALARHFGD